MPVGFHIYHDVNRPSAALIEQFRGISTADLVDVMFKRGAVDNDIRPVYTPIASVAGPAVTVSVPDAAFNVVKAGLGTTRPGDVVMVNARGNVHAALVGGNVCRGLKARGVAAFLADGAVRDVAEIQSDGLPVFARGTSTRMGPLMGAGEVNVPIAFGGVVVNPGDIIVADADGIAVVPPEAAGLILEAVRDLHARHEAVQPVLLRGEVTNIDAIREQLAQHGATFHDAAFSLPGPTSEDG